MPLGAGIVNGERQAGYKNLGLQELKQTVRTLSVSWSFFPEVR